MNQCLRGSRIKESFKNNWYFLLVSPGRFRLCRFVTKLRLCSSPVTPKFLPDTIIRKMPLISLQILNRLRRNFSCQALRPDFGVRRSRAALVFWTAIIFPTGHYISVRNSVFSRNLKRRRVAALQRLFHNHKEPKIQIPIQSSLFLDSSFASLCEIIFE